LVAYEFARAKIVCWLTNHDPATPGKLRYERERGRSPAAKQGMGMTEDVRSIAAFRAFERSTPRYVDHEELLYMLHELSRIISVHFDRAMSRHQLTHSQWWALMHVFQHEGATQSELANIMQLGRASAGGVIERLEAKGWVERRPDPNDNRVRRVYLRDASAPIFMLMNEEGQRVFKTWMAGIEPEAEAGIIAGLRRIKANADAAEPSRE
jgi:MarR family transcriptional regulator, transcriptional regulator for hemolysin